MMTPGMKEATKALATRDTDCLEWIALDMK